jgi:GTPase SAR1 family protein
MSTCWRLKVTLVGSSRVGKTSFIKGRSDFERSRLNNLRTFGISFEVIDTFLDNEEMCRCSVWEINQHTRYTFFYPSFFKGVAGSLMFFDLSRHQTFEDLNLWIKLIRKINGNIPVFLIGTKEDRGPEVFPEEIEYFIRNYGIIGYNATTIYGESKRDNIFKKLITDVIGKRTIKAENHDQLEPIQESVEDILNQLNSRVYHREVNIDEHYRFLSCEEKAICDQFMEYYAFCPICRTENHVNYLKKFYFSKKRKDIELKSQLLKLMALSKNFDELYYNKIILGIPCCDCFKSFFTEKAPELRNIGI